MAGPIGREADPQALIGRLLERMAVNLKADDVFAVNAEGDCLADAGAGSRTCVDGVRYAGRAFFEQAKSGAQGVEYALTGPGGSALGLYFASPVSDGGRFAGALVIKRNLDSLRSGIRHTKGFLVDDNGVIVLAADSAMEFRTLPGTRVEGMPGHWRQLQYGPLLRTPLDVTLHEVGTADGTRSLAERHPMPVVSQTVAGASATLYVPLSLQELSRLESERAALFILVTAVGAMMIVALAAVALYLRETRRTGADLRIAATAFEAHDPTIITDAKGVILRANRAYQEATGYVSEELTGRKPAQLQTDSEDPDQATGIWKDLRREGSWRGEVWDSKKGGDRYLKDLTIVAVRGREGEATHYVATYVDITQRKAAEREIENLAFYDPLTRLPNRRLLRDRLQQALAGCKRGSDAGALLFIDMDNFKQLNDTRGHAMGDLLLQQVGQRLGSCVRKDDVVARLGGDEFVTMLRGLSTSPLEAGGQAKLVGEKVLSVLNQPYTLAGEIHHSTCSIGIALFADSGDTVDELLKRADVAMYQAKSAGRNGLCFFDPTMQSALMARAALEADLRQGLANGQLELFYQGQAGSNNELVGAEALLRWRHPRLGWVPPSEFIPLAEESGLILSLGLWVLETACRQLVVWGADPLTADLTLAVNVSSRQFRSPEFVSQVLSVLDSTGADPHRLKLEITESLMLKDVPETIQKMSILKSHGIGFSIDDFGTGYSSLAYLRRLPLDQIKIDKSFVQDVLADANDAAIVRTIVALADSLGLQVVAEGVETAAQRDFLAANGCLLYQGFLFSRPCPANEFQAALERAQPRLTTTGA